MRENPYPPNHPTISINGNPHIYLTLKRIQDLINKKKLSISVDNSRVFKVGEKVIIKCRKKDSNNDIRCLVSIISVVSGSLSFNYENSSMILIQLLKFQVS